MCEESSIKCGNELNTALEKIVHDCTRTTVIKSNHRIKRSHVNRDFILAVRERNRLFTLIGLYPNNTSLGQQYLELQQYVKFHNYNLRATYECNRLEAATGDDRKIWKLYKEIVFNQHQQKLDRNITIGGIPTTETIDSCNAINNHFCAAGEQLAASIVSIHDYELEDIDTLYPEHADDN